MPVAHASSVSAGSRRSLRTSRKSVTAPSLMFGNPGGAAIVMDDTVPLGTATPADLGLIPGLRRRSYAAALVNLASVLSQQEKPEWKQVERLLSECPPMHALAPASSHSVLGGDENVSLTGSDPGGDLGTSGALASSAASSPVASRGGSVPASPSMGGKHKRPHSVSPLDVVSGSNGGIPSPVAVPGGVAASSPRSERGEDAGAPAAQHHESELSPTQKRFGHSRSGSAARSVSSIASAASSSAAVADPVDALAAGSPVLASSDASNLHVVYAGPTPRSESAVAAVARFLIDSKGQYADVIVASLTQYLSRITCFDWSDEHAAESFTWTLVAALMDIAGTKSGSEAEAIRIMEVIERTALAVFDREIQRRSRRGRRSRTGKAGASDTSAAGASNGAGNGAGNGNAAADNANHQPGDDDDDHDGNGDDDNVDDDDDNDDDHDDDDDDAENDEQSAAGLGDAQHDGNGGRVSAGLRKGTSGRAGADVAASDGDKRRNTRSGVSSVYRGMLSGLVRGMGTRSLPWSRAQRVALLNWLLRVASRVDLLFPPTQRKASASANGVNGKGAAGNGAGKGADSGTGNGSNATANGGGGGVSTSSSKNRGEGDGKDSEQRGTDEALSLDDVVLVESRPSSPKKPAASTATAAATNSRRAAAGASSSGKGRSAARRGSRETWRPGTAWSLPPLRATRRPISLLSHVVRAINHVIEDNAGGVVAETASELLSLGASAMDRVRRAALPGSDDDGEDMQSNLLQHCITLHVNTAKAYPDVKTDVYDMLASSEEDSVIAEFTARCTTANQLAVYRGILQGMTALAIHFPDLGEHVLESAQTWLMGDLAFSSAAMREEAMDAVCAILHHDMAQHHNALLADTVMRMAEALYAHGPGSQLTSAQVRATDNTAVLLGRIAVRLGTPRVCADIVPILREALDQDLDSIGGTIVRALADIALLEIPFEFHRISGWFLEMYRQEPTSARRYRMSEIPNALQCMAGKLKSKALRMRLLADLLKVFVNLGLDMQAMQAAEDSDPNKQLRARVGQLGLLLPAIAELMATMEPEQLQQGDDTLCNDLRSMWFYAVLFGFVNQGIWIDEWYDAAVSIAGRMPVLILSDTLLSYNTIQGQLSDFFGQGISETEVAQLQKVIDAHLREMSGRRHGFAATMYVASVLHLETLRLRRVPSLRYVLRYLEDQSLATSEIGGAMRGIFDLVLSQFIDLMHERGRHASRNAVLETEVTTLLFAFAHRLPRVRDAAASSISQLHKQFPQVLWSKVCLRTMLDLLEALGQSCKVEVGRELKRITLRSADAVLDLPEVLESRENILHQLTTLCSHWITAAVHHAPSEIDSLLQDILQDLHVVSLRMGHHLGISLALSLTSAMSSIDPAYLTGVSAGAGAPAAAAVAASAAASSLPPVDPATQRRLGGLLWGSSADANKSTGAGSGGAGNTTANNYSSEFVTSLKQKALYVGEVDGMNDVIADTVMHVSGVAAGRTSTVSLNALLPGLDTERARLLVQHVARQLRDVMAAVQHGEQVPQPHLHALMLRAAALVSGSAAEALQNESDVLDLLRLVCYVPVMVFTVAAMETAVFTWGWLHAARPDLSSAMLVNMSVAWFWSITTRRGLFSNDPAHPSSPQPAHGHHPPNAEPHRIWLAYLAQRYEVVRHKHQDHVDIIGEMLQRALADPHALSVGPNSVAMRFQLLHLAMQLVLSGFLSDARATMLLRQRVYGAALAWFAMPPRWHDAATVPQLEADIAMLTSFCHQIHQDRYHWQTQLKRRVARTSSVPQPYPAGRGISDAVTNGSSRRLEAGRRGGDGGAASMLSDGGGSDARSVGSRSVMTTGSMRGIMLMHRTATASAGSRASDGASVGQHELEGNVIRANLLLLLLGHEIDRIIAWNNGCAYKRLKVMDEKTFSVEGKTMSSQSAAEYVRYAWTHSPTLAVYLARRFPGTPTLAKAVGLRVRAEPHAVAHLADALPFLVTEQTLAAKDSASQLQPLLYWAPVPAAVALGLLSRRCAASPPVLEYAVRVLMNISEKDFLFFLPQLVQSLAWDTDGVIETFLFAYAQRNPTISHQLIWNIRTESDISNKERETFVNRLGKLRDRLIAGYNDAERRLYEYQFRFFDKVTEISGILKPLPSDQRKAKIIERLKAIAEHECPIERGVLYLPSAPEYKVVGFEFERARPLQSHAKVPIMVTFSVVRAVGTAPVQLDEPGHVKADAARSRTSLSAEDAASRKPGTKRRGAAAAAAAAAAMPDDMVSTGSEASATPANVTLARALIFKVGDDVRQDRLALQLISVCRSIVHRAGLKLYLFPYRVVATEGGNGIIEVVQNARSRDELGKQNEGNLYNYFLERYGSVESLEYQRARRNFILSMAGYSIVSFLLQVKDRHNGNIMIHNDGSIIHIDFGFLFNISPGGDLKFERAPFKLNKEMIDIMGGSPDAEPFRWFTELCVKGFLAIRNHVDKILPLVELMMETDLPCFKPQTMATFKRRFCIGASEKVAVKFMQDKIIGSFDAVSSKVYDRFQKLQNDIEH